MLFFRFEKCLQSNHLNCVLVHIFYSRSLRCRCRFCNVAEILIKCHKGIAAYQHNHIWLLRWLGFCRWYFKIPLLLLSSLTGLTVLKLARAIVPVVVFGGHVVCSVCILCAYWCEDWISQYERSYVFIAINIQRSWMALFRCRFVCWIFGANGANFLEPMSLTKMFFSMANIKGTAVPRSREQVWYNVSIWKGRYLWGSIGCKYMTDTEHQPFPTYSAEPTRALWRL